MQSITLRRPDDWHLHLRDGAILQSVVPHTVRQFARAVIMPNLTPPITTVDSALAYRQRILDVLQEPAIFNPLMTLYLTDSTSTDEIKRAAECPHVIGCKLYPAGATTHSDAGVTNLNNIYSILESMERFEVPLLIHGEVTDSNIDIFDREQAFIDQHLTKIVDKFGQLRIVLEHITTQQAVQFVSEARAGIAATITPQHLLLNRNAILVGGINPHNYCLPVLKRERHRTALVQAATSGNAKFFLGTDSAPHAKPQKESNCGCAGCFTAHAALELYAEIFDGVGCLDKLNDFASVFGANFYRLPTNDGTIRLERKDWVVPDSYPFADDCIVPFKAGETLRWKLSADDAMLNQKSDQTPQSNQAR